MYVLASKDDCSKPFFRTEVSNDEPMADESVDAESASTVLPKPLEHAGKSKESISKSKTERGYGKKIERNNKTNKVNLSIMETNANGLKPKMESFYHNINKFKPSICTIQETKHNKVGIFKIQGYQTFEK